MQTIEIEAEVIPPTTQLDLAVQSAGVSETAIEQLKSKFGFYFAEAGKLVESARGISVTDATQLTEMAQARELRLKLAKVRIEADKERKEMKEDSLRTGRAIDGINNVLKAIIEPVESHLKEQEDFAKIAEARRKEELRAKRALILADLGADSQHFDLANMDADAFENLAAGIHAANRARIEAEKQAREERIAREKAEAEERERQRAENARLKAEAEKREKEIAAEFARIQKEREAERAKLEKEKRKQWEEGRAERERLEKEKAIIAKKAAEDLARVKEFEAREAEAKAAAARKAAEELKAVKVAAKAPDKAKLLAFADAIDALAAPDDLTFEWAEQIRDSTIRAISSIANTLREAIALRP